jgi:kynurenine formamidase
MNAQRKYIDLSHVVEDGMITYKGLPAPIICDYLTREESRKTYTHGTEFQIGKIEMVSNTGTYIDVPFHRFADGEDLADVGLERLVDLPAVVVRVPEGVSAIGADFVPEDVAGLAVLFHTCWSRNWRTDAYFEDYPALTGEAATALVDRGAALMGIDSFNADLWEDKSRPVHTRLLAAGIPIIEHMTDLDRVPDTGGRLYAAPVKFRGVGTFPVRVFVQTGA